MKRHLNLKDNQEIQAFSCPDDRVGGDVPHLNYFKTPTQYPVRPLQPGAKHLVRGTFQFAKLLPDTDFQAQKIEELEHPFLQLRRESSLQRTVGIRKPLRRQPLIAGRWQRSV